MDLYPYQSAAISRARDAIRAGQRRVLLVAPTGSGKTVLAGFMIQQVAARGGRAVFLAHRKELIDQPSRLLESMAIRHGVVKAGHWRVDPAAPVQVASIQTLEARKQTIEGVTLLIVDEAHRCRSASYERVIARHSGAVLVGLTATPWRLDKKGLGSIYHEVIVVATPGELISDGHLVEPRVFAPSAPNMASVGKTGGDWKPAEAAEEMQRSVLVGDMVGHWRKYAEGRRTVCFASTCEHSRKIVEAFTDAGIRAEHVDGHTADGERTAILERLRTGDTTVVCNVDLVTEGYDLPELSCAILARPTESITKYIQMIGRIMRTHESKTDAIVLDHAGCTVRHGFVSDERDYSIDSATPKAKPISDCKVCGSCMAVVPSAARTCPSCNESMAAESVPREGPQEVGGDLAEYSKTATECGSCGDTNTLIERISEFRVAIVCRRCGNRQGETDEQKAASADMAAKRREWKRLDAIRAAKGYNPGWTAHQYRAVFQCWPRGVKDG
jgi:superfamily II DNA or RNA helicase